MSELKSKHVVDVYDAYSSNPYNEARVYLKSEADKVIAHHKYKRCLAMARLCESELSSYPWYGDISNEERRLQKWQQRWLKIAEKFKEAK